MQKPSQDDVEKLVTELIWPFYSIQRDMLVPDKPWRNENDAEHSWSLGLVACALAERVAPELDLGTVSQYALVHDLVEVYAGDTTPWDNPSKIDSKEAREEAALEKIDEHFKVFPWIAQTIKEYEKRADDEAKFVWATDKYLALCMRFLDEGETYHKKGITVERFRTGTQTQRRKAGAHPVVSAYYDELMDLFLSHHEYFANSADTKRPEQ